MGRRAERSVAGSLLVAAALAACSGGSAGGGDGGPGQRAFATTSTSVTAGQSILLDDAQADFAQQSYPVSIGATFAALVRVTPTRLSLFIPAATPAAYYTVSPVVDGVAYVALGIQVSASAAPPDPASFEQAQVAAATAALQGWQQRWSSRADLTPVFSGALANVQAFDAAFQGWDAATQAQAAGYLQANPLVAASARDGFAVFAAEVSGRWSAVGADLGAQAALAGSTFGPLATSALLSRDAAALADSFGFGTTTPLQPLPGSGGLGDALDGGLPVNEPLVFSSAVITAMPAPLLLKTLSRDELTAAQAPVAPVVAAFQGLATAWPAIAAGARGPLGSAPQLSAIAPLTGAVEAPFAGLAITNTVPLQTVQLTSFTAGDGTTEAQFTSFSCGFASFTSTPFTFDLDYDDGLFPAKTLSISATLQCPTN